MNNEIKEILEEMKSIIDTGKDRNGIKVDGYGFHGKDLKLLYDCITNLQQENERLKKRNEEIYKGYMSVVDELTEYAEENERLKDKCHELYEENERLKEWKEDLLKENIELENIRKEAIEYINIFKNDIRGIDEIVLLNILQNGSDSQ